VAKQVSTYHFNLKPRESYLILLDHNEPVYRILDGQLNSYKKTQIYVIVSLTKVLSLTMLFLPTQL